MAQSLIRNPEIRPGRLDPAKVGLRGGPLFLEGAAFPALRKAVPPHMGPPGRKAPGTLIGAAKPVTGMALTGYRFRSGIEGQPGAAFQALTSPRPRPIRRARMPR